MQEAARNIKKNECCFACYRTKVNASKRLIKSQSQAIVTQKLNVFLKKLRSIALALAFFGGPFSSVFAQNSVDLDEKVWTERAQLFQPDSSMASNLVTVGRGFLGTPYVAGVLDKYLFQKTGPEALVVNLRQLDCVTFVEAATAICAVKKDTQLADYQRFKSILTSLRYRDGIVDGYASRLHYFSEWLDQQKKAGRLEIITEQLGGQKMRKKIAYMTAHRKFYKGLESEKNFEKMFLVERRLSARELFWIPKQRVSFIEKHLKDGDLIAITSSKDDLDLAHEGFAVWQNGRVHLLHASFDLKKVVISERPLAEYLAQNSGQSGIMVARFF